MPWGGQAPDTGGIGGVVGGGHHLATGRTNQPSRRLQLGTVLLAVSSLFLVSQKYLNYVCSLSFSFNFYTF